MAKVTPTTPVRALPNSSFNVPANFTRRGTGKAGTNSAGVCTVRLGACGSALTACCACIPTAPQPRENNKPTPTHLMVQFMGSPLSSAAEEIQIFSRVKPRCASNEGGRSREVGDDPEKYANTTLDSIQSQLKVVLLGLESLSPSRVVILRVDARRALPELFRGPLFLATRDGPPVKIAEDLSPPSSTFVQPESLLQCDQNLDDAFSFAQRLERLPHHGAQHPKAVRALHGIPGC